MVHVRFLRVLEVLAILVGMTATAPAAADTPCVSSQMGVCVGRVTLDSGQKLPYYRNLPLSGNASVTRAVVVVHGKNRDPWNSFHSIVDAAMQAGQDQQTIVIAPYFQTADDAPAYDEAYWTSSAWMQGDGAVVPQGLSSFAVIDQILTRLGDRTKFPQLNQITVVGHSAGGQFVQRYTAGGIPWGTSSGITRQYVVANPSSFLYLNPLRPDFSDPSGNSFAVPYTTCSYDDYKYGLNNLNPYLQAVGADVIVGRYTRRKVTYLLGDVDVGVPADTSCPAVIQGYTRFDRGTYYASYIQQFFPTAPHSRVVVPGVGHDEYGMFTSTQGVTVLFP